MGTFLSFISANINSAVMGGIVTPIFFFVMLKNGEVRMSIQRHWASKRLRILLVLIGNRDSRIDCRCIVGQWTFYCSPMLHSMQRGTHGSASIEAAVRRLPQVHSGKMCSLRMARGKRVLDSGTEAGKMEICWVYSALYVALLAANYKCRNVFPSLCVARTTTSK